jgi:hypothetical protein
MENSNQEHWNNPQPVKEKITKKIAAGILALLLAPFGVHKFLLGYTKRYNMACY